MARGRHRPAERKRGKGWQPFGGWYVSVLFLAMLWMGRALAAAVVIVRPVIPSAAMGETVVRIQGELMSAGFRAEIVDAATAASASEAPRDSLERLAEQRGADAVVAIVGELAPNSIEVWVVDKVTGKSVIRRLPYEPQSERAPQTLAIRAIELLRSSFLEIHLASNGPGSEQPTAKPSPTVVQFVGIEASPPRSERVGVEVGATAVIGTGGVGPAFLPVVQLDWVVHPSLLAQVSVAGLGSRPTVESDLGSAQVSQEYALFGGCYRARASERLRPFMSLSAGALHTSVEGRGNVPNPGLSDQKWSLLLDGGVGAWLQLRDRFQLALAAHVQVAEPYLGVRFAGKVVATSARPNVLVTLTVGAWL